MLKTVLKAIKFDQEQVELFKSCHKFEFNLLKGTLVVLFSNYEIFQIDSLNDMTTLTFIHAKVTTGNLTILGIVDIGDRQLKYQYRYNGGHHYVDAKIDTSIVERNTSLMVDTGASIDILE